MIPIAVLVVAGGIAYFPSRQGGEAPPAGDGGPVSAVWRYPLLCLVLLLVLARGYLGPVVNGWSFPRGVDRYEHAVMAGMMMGEGSNESFMLYPPGFHLLTAMISRLSGIEPLEVFPILAPMLPLLGALALYALAKRLWGWEYGVAAALTAGLLLGGTYLHFEEARYPNFIGEYFLIVLAMAALVGMYAAPSARGGAVAGPARLLDGSLPPDRGLQPRRAARGWCPFSSCPTCSFGSAGRGSISCSRSRSSVSSRCSTPGTPTTCPAWW